MSERSERLFEALSEIDENKIDEASPEGWTNRTTWKRWGALAAALVLAAGVGSYVLPRLGGSAGNGGVGGSGTGGATTFMSYAGPVFPLTLKEADSAITAEREITLDFAPWVPVWWSNEEEAASREDVTPEVRQEILDDYNGWYPEGGRWKSSTDIQVTDAYTLTNTSAEDRTVSVLYPFSSSLHELWRRQPTLAAEGSELEAALHAGGYTGGFQGVDGGGGEQLLNLAQVNSWEGYKALLSDGRYQDTALGDFPDLSDIPVVVYRFFDSYGPEANEKAGYPNPSIRAYFDLDYDKTTVLSYGFHAGRFDSEGGHMIQGFSIRQPGEPWYGEPYYLIVVGEDIRNLTTGAYVTGGTDGDTKKVDHAGVSVERYTSDLETALRRAAELMYSSWRWEDGLGNRHFPEFEMYFGLLKEFLCSYGTLSESGVARYHTGWLEELDVVNVDRVFYLETEVTIPAGGSVTLAAEMRKAGSYDFYCAQTENRGIYGYDMVTRLGSNLNCTGQTAVLEDWDQIEIVRQNFGFDLENGVKKVTLAPDQEHYYLEVKAVPREK